MARNPKKTADAVKGAETQEEVDEIIGREAPTADDVNAVSDELEADG